LLVPILDGLNPMKYRQQIGNNPDFNVSAVGRILDLMPHAGH